MRLSTREKQILTLCERGRLYKEIAAALAISLSTVKTHALHARLKLGATNMREAAWRHRQPVAKLR